MGSLETQLQHYLGSCEKCTLGPHPDLLNQTPEGKTGNGTDSPGDSEGWELLTCHSEKPPQSKSASAGRTRLPGNIPSHWPRLGSAESRGRTQVWHTWKHCNCKTFQRKIQNEVQRKYLFRIREITTNFILIYAKYHEQLDNMILLLIYFLGRLLGGFSYYSFFHCILFVCLFRGQKCGNIFCKD